MNISEFAKVAGVSVSAVSRYFNDGYLSAEKRAAIEAAIEKTGYAPSLSARSVRTRVTKLVGVILPKLSSESCARVTEGISEVLNAQGYELLLVNTSNSTEKEIKSIKLFSQNRVDGVILLGAVFTKAHFSALNKMRVPVVIVGQNIKGFNCVFHNDEGAAYALTKHMIEKGAKKIAAIAATPDDLAAGKARYDGFMKALDEANMTIDKKYIEVARFDMESGYEKAKRIFSHKERPDAVFCATDNIAAGAMFYCREAGLNVPRDVMICGVGDSKLGKITSAPLTSAHLHYKTAGMEAASMLLSSMRHRSPVHKVLQLDYYIAERESTKRK